MSSAIVYYNRYTRRNEEEKVYGDSFIRFLYEKPLGQWVEQNILSSVFFSAAYGWYQATPLSRGKIPRFIADYLIPMQEFEDGPFGCFNDFFIREFRPGARKFTAESAKMPAFAEGRYLGFAHVADDLAFPVKGAFLTAERLLAKKIPEFEGGPLLIARLCPVDYHRFHFPDDGRILDSYRVSGAYHSVNPIAVKQVPQVFIQNERQVTIMETANFGKIAYVEVGAMCVGKIVQSFTENTRPIGVDVKRGQEKGYFLFGGSTVIVLGEPGRWKPSADILENTAKKIETYAHLGDAVAQK